jgi:hypothetical protein
VSGVATESGVVSGVATETQSEIATTTRAITKSRAATAAVTQGDGFNNFNRDGFNTNQGANAQSSGANARSAGASGHTQQRQTEHRQKRKARKYSDESVDSTRKYSGASWTSGATSGVVHEGGADAATSKEFRRKLKENRQSKSNAGRKVNRRHNSANRDPASDESMSMRVDAEESLEGSVEASGAGSIGAPAAGSAAEESDQPVADLYYRSFLVRFLKVHNPEHKRLPDGTSISAKKYEVVLRNLPIAMPTISISLIQFSSRNTRSFFVTYRRRSQCQRLVFPS